MRLLKRIVREAFESENIDSANEVARLTAEHERRIDRFDEHIKEPRVESLPKMVRCDSQCRESSGSWIWHLG